MNTEWCNRHGCPANQCSCLGKKQKHRERIRIEHELLCDALKECLYLLGRLGYGQSPTAMDSHELLDKVFTPDDL